MVELYIYDNSPRWDDILADPLAVFPWLAGPPGKRICRPQRVLVDDEHVPVAVLRYPSSTFRREVTPDTELKVLFDVVTVLPFPTPFAYVIPIIDDDIQDPFYSQTLLNLLPVVQGEVGSDRAVAEAVCAANRLLVACFCEADQRGLVLLDDRCRLVTAALLNANSDEERTRRREILDVLELLDTYDIMRHTASTEALSEVFSKVFCREIMMRDGRAVLIPRKRSLSTARSSVFSIMRDHDRLTDRRSVHARNREPTPDIDVFLSHAHADAGVVLKIDDWLRGAWPNLRIARTDPADEKTFRERPSDFLIRVRRARCILYVASPNSLDRPMVDTEIGVSADKPILSLLIGGFTIERLREKNDTSPFLTLDPAHAIDTAVSDWPQRLGDLLVATLGLSPPNAPPPPYLPPFRSIEDQNVVLSYFQDWLAIAGDLYGVKDRDLAHEMLDQRLLENARAEGGDPERLSTFFDRFPTEYKLLTLLQTFRSEAHWRECLRAFPVLLNDDLLACLASLKDSTVREQSSVAIKQLARMEAVVTNEILARTLLPLPTWVIDRGTSFLKEIGLHPKLLEYFDHQQAGGHPADFDFGFHQPKGEPPLDAVRSSISHALSARDWFIGGLTRKLLDAATQSSYGRALFVTTDFHTGHLSSLAGSDWLEKQEADPDRGMRGMLRYLQPCYRAPLEWELEACRRVAEGSTKVAIVFPLVRVPEELSKSIATILEHRVKPWAVGTIPEAPSNVLNARDFVAAMAASVKETGLRLLLLLDFDALSRAHNLSASALDQDSGKQLMNRVIATLIAEACSAAQAAGIDLEFGISRSGLDRLKQCGARSACALAKHLTFLVDE